MWRLLPAAQVARNWPRMSTSEAIPPARRPGSPPADRECRASTWSQGPQQAASLLNGNRLLHQVAHGQSCGVRNVLRQQRLHTPKSWMKSISSSSRRIRHEDVEDLLDAHHPDQRPLFVDHGQGADMPVYHQTLSSPPTQSCRVRRDTTCRLMQSPIMAVLPCSESEPSPSPPWDQQSS